MTGSKRFSWFACSFVLALLLGTGDRLLAADVVAVRSADGKRETRITGEIVDWLGPELILRRSSGREERIPSDRVLNVDATWNEAHVQAEGLRNVGDLAAALVLFNQAIRSEERAWVRRRLLARIVECNAETGQIEQAGETFAALIQSDPQTPDFAVIPLNWGTVRTTAGLESIAGRWLSAKSASVKLLGASWLLSSAQRNQAVAALNRLASDPDARVAFLAKGQLWRTEVVTVTDASISKWQDVIRRMPEPLRAGPYFVVADALARREQPQQAALHWMRIPILYPQQRQLAAEALWGAANQLERIEQTPEALALYREIVSRHKDAPCAAQAEQRLLTAGKKAEP